MTKHTKQALGIVVLVLALSASGCIFKKGPPGGWKPVQPGRASLVHEVKWPEETLPMIAKWYTGDTRGWKMIVNANPAIDPERLHIGSRVFIPGEMVKKNKPMPRDFVSGFHGEEERKSPPAGTAGKAGQKTKTRGPGSEEFEMFGPR